MLVCFDWVVGYFGEVVVIKVVGEGFDFVVMGLYGYFVFMNVVLGLVVI